MVLFGALIADLTAEWKRLLSLTWSCQIIYLFGSVIGSVGCEHFCEIFVSQIIRRQIIRLVQLNGSMRKELSDMSMSEISDAFTFLLHLRAN